MDHNQASLAPRRLKLHKIPLLLAKHKCKTLRDELEKLCMWYMCVSRYITYSFCVLSVFVSALTDVGGRLVEGIMTALAPLKPDPINNQKVCNRCI